MFRNYFKIAFRHIGKNKGFSLLNLTGLALGITCAILILLWVEDELGYDKFHSKYSHLHQVMENQHFDGKTYTFSALPGLLSSALKTDLPEIKNAARVDWTNKWLFSIGEKSVFEKGFRVDSSFLEMFSFPLVKGSVKTAFNNIHSILITEKMADKFFGDSDPIGKSIKVNNKQEFTVTGVLKDIPQSSSLQFDWLAPFRLFEEENSSWSDWGTNGIKTYVELQPTADPKQVDKKLYSFIHNKDTSTIAKPFLFSISDWRLCSKFEDGKIVDGRIQYVRLFSIIAALIILIACINFMNLATARSEQRAREVGVRKVLGAQRWVLVRQFLAESFVMAFAAVVLSIAITFLLLPAFNALVEKQMRLDLFNPLHAGILIGLVFFCGLLAGSYPSLYLSSFNPAVAFKGLRIGKSSITVFVRKGLVITQFAVGIVLIISTIIVYMQINHIRNRQLGFDKENVLFTSMRGDMQDKFTVINNNLMATGAVVKAGMGGWDPLTIGSSSTDFGWEGKPGNKDVLVSMNSVNPTYISTMGMKLIEGRDFYADALQDSNSVIINEAFAKIIGKKNLAGSILHRNGRDLTIAGVVKDFVFDDIYKQPDPMVFFCHPEETNVMVIRLRSGQDVSTAVAKVENIVKQVVPEYPFEYKFLDQSFEERFKSEAMVGKLSRLFAMLAIIISCLGLFGLAAYMAERRTKEIGIRKVLGASVEGVVALLSKDFLKLVTISILIATPLAWWFMHNWLQDFAYRVDIGWWVFVLAGAVALAVAVFTVSFQAIKAAMANPVKSLRRE